MSTAQHIKTGQEGERLAVAYLESTGHSILETNWTFERYELDVIARKNDEIIFVEVKTRTGTSHGFPEQAVTRKKAKTMFDGASIYLEENELENEIRFDIVSIVLRGETPDILHIKDAISPSLF